jgi:hypothetical protein
VQSVDHGVVVEVNGSVAVVVVVVIVVVGVGVGEGVGLGVVVFFLGVVVGAPEGQHPVLEARQSSFAMQVL